MSTEAAPGAGVGTASTKRTRRPRAIQACNRCRLKKYKCDGNLPCIHCRKHGIDCVFRKPEAQDPEAPTYSISYVKRLERRLELAEAALRGRDDGRPPTGSSPQHLALVAAAGDASIHAQPSQAGVFASPLSEYQTQQPKDLPQAEEESEESAAEIVDVNSDTNAIEFHGNTSSLAFLGLVCEEYGSTPGTARNAHERRHSLSHSPSLVMAFHNNAFRKDGPGVVALPEENLDDFYPKHARTFLDVYFRNLHYIHPIVDHADFLQRCESLWVGGTKRQPRSFCALYYSILSLGALIRTWTEKKIDGMSRFDWSRKLFQKAEDALIRPGFFNDLHAVQALFILAKVCQNEMNPNLAYTYLGMAVRSALSIGLNRNVRLGRKDGTTHDGCSMASKVWWGIYSLEVELSFALGRPDTTGMDAYHQRDLPPIDESEFAIIPLMLPVCRIMRDISLTVYLTKEDLAARLAKADQLADELDAWYDSLPPRLHSGDSNDGILTTGLLATEMWPGLQSLVMKLRHLNVKMILFRPFLLQAAKRAQSQPLNPDLRAAVNKCALAATMTIDIIYTTLCHHVFFRTWWYSATYTTFAASIMLFCAAQKTFDDLVSIDPLTSSEKALEILDALAEGVVAKNIANFLRPIVARLRSRNTSKADMPDAPAPQATTTTTSELPYLGVPGFDPSTWNSAMSDLDFFQTGLSFIDGGFWDFDVGFNDAVPFEASAAPGIAQLYPT